MQPIFFICCQADNCINFREGDWCLQWSRRAPELGTSVSMGGEARWRIVKITTYRPEAAQNVDSLYIARVHPFGLPVPHESEWDSDLDDPPQSIHADLVVVGQEALELNMMRSLIAPEIGEQIESILEPTEEGDIFHENPKLWIRRRVVPYLPVSETRILTQEETTLTRAFLGWCELQKTVLDPQETNE